MDVLVSSAQQPATHAAVESVSKEDVAKVASGAQPDSSEYEAGECSRDQDAEEPVNVRLEDVAHGKDRYLRRCSVKT